MFRSCQCLTYTPILSLFLSSSVFLYYLDFIPQGLITTFFFPTWLTMPGFSVSFQTTPFWCSFTFSFMYHRKLYYIGWCVGWNIHCSCPCFRFRVIFVLRKISPKIWTTFIYILRLYEFQIFWHVLGVTLLR